MRGIKEFLIPDSLDDTLKLLNLHQEKAVVLSGGTHLSLLKETAYEVMIDIKRLGLSFIKEENGNIKIGATTRAVDIINSTLLKTFAGGILAIAASKIASPLTQNLVTLGGNIYSLFPWANLPPALLVLDSSVEISSLAGKRLVKLQDLLGANPKKFLKSNEIITAVLIPKDSNNLKTSYKVFSLIENDYDIAIVAVGLKMESKICKEARIAVGAAVSPSSIIVEAGKLLEHKELTHDLIDQTANCVISNINLRNDFRTTKEHCSEVVKTLVKRALEDCSL